MNRDYFFRISWTIGAVLIPNLNWSTLNRTIAEDPCANLQTASRLESVERLGWRPTSPTATARTQYLLTNARDELTNTNRKSSPSRTIPLTLRPVRLAPRATFL